MSANYKINIIYSIESLYVVYIHKYAHINNYNRNLIIYNINIMNNTNINIYNILNIYTFTLIYLKFINSHINYSYILNIHINI